MKLWGTIACYPDSFHIDVLVTPRELLSFNSPGSEFSSSKFQQPHKISLRIQTGN